MDLSMNTAGCLVKLAGGVPQKRAELRGVVVAVVVPPDVLVEVRRQVLLRDGVMRRRVQKLTAET
jgi:hypothetical protein